MREAEFEAIREIAREMGQDAAGAEFLRLAGSSSDAVPDEIREDLDSLLHFVAEVAVEGESDAKRELEPALTLFDLGLAQLSHLAMLFPGPSESNGPLLWPSGEPSTRGPGGAFLAQVLLTNLANTLLGVRSLICSGLDVQARILLRQYVEIGDMTLAVLGDRESYDAYLQLAGDPDAFRRAWKSRLSPQRVRQRLSLVEREVGLSEDMSVETAAMRHSTYQWLSYFAHGQWVALLTGAYPSDISDHRPRLFGLGGRVSAASKATLFHGVRHTWLFLRLAVRLLFDKHKWNFGLDVDDKENRWFFVRQEVFNKLFLSKYQTMQKELESLWPDEEAENSHHTESSEA